MSIEAINEQLLRSVGVGVALFAGERLELEFRNDVFSAWFEDAGDESGLRSLFPDLDVAALLQGVEAGGRYSTEVKLRKKRRTLVLAQTFTRADIGEQSLLVLECQNITRIRELESMIESYSNMVERNTREIQREKERVEKLLLNILPRAAYEEYRDFGIVAPQRHDSVSVLVLELVGFADKVERLPPATLVSELNELYGSFDRIGEQLSCERIRTTGDSYRCMAGMQGGGEAHLRAVAGAATRFIRYLNRRNANADNAWQCRIGIGTGSVVGSVVGNQKYVYDVFGAAVEAAVEARSHAAAMETLVLGSAVTESADGLRVTDPSTDAARRTGLVALVDG